MVNRNRRRVYGGTLREYDLNKAERTKLNCSEKGKIWRKNQQKKGQGT
jgi:hypothetical protein